MLIQTLYVPKGSGSYADVLVGVGVADLVQSLAEASEVWVRDTGDTYMIDVSPALDTDMVRSTTIGPGYPYLLLKAGDPRAPIADIFRYDDERTIAKQASAAAKGGSKKALQVAAEQDISTDLAVNPDLQVFTIYNQMRVGSDTYNQLHATLRETEILPTLVADRLECLATLAPSFGKLASSERPLAKAASNLQFFNPIAGKGVTESKPRGTNLGSLPDQLVDWFDVWMKVRALQKVLLAYRAGDDFKILVLAPGAVPSHHLAGLRLDLLRQRLWGTVRLDVEAALALAELLVRRSPANTQATDQDPFPFPSGATPRDVVHGFACAYFKSLGNASATMNVSFLGLPGWFPVDTPQQVDDWLSILAEYRRRARSLREDFSDHMPSLIAFRDFVSGGRLDDGLELFVTYATLLLQQGERLIPFRADNMRRVFMAYAKERPTLAEIIQDDGFKHLAAAIRACTIRAQYHKAALDTHRRSDPMRVDIRYGLVQDWKRVVDRKDSFVEKLAEFVAEFNAEAARRREKQDPHEQPVSVADLERVVRLIERDGSSSLVGKLLIAFGYASDWRGTDQRDQQAGDGTAQNSDVEDKA